MNTAKKRVCFRVEHLPALATNVGVAGSTHFQEVGGIVCLATAAGVVVYFSA